MIHLDNVVDRAESGEMKSSFSPPQESKGFSPVYPVVTIDEFWKQPAEADVALPRSIENQVNDDDDDLGKTTASHDFYNMVLDILDTFHSAAEMEVRRTRKRDFQRQDAMNMLM